MTGTAHHQLPLTGLPDFRHHLELVTPAGYDGGIEVKIFNADGWAADPDDVVSTMKQCYADVVSGP